MNFDEIINPAADGFFLFLFLDAKMPPSMLLHLLRFSPFFSLTGAAHPQQRVGSQDFQGGGVCAQQGRGWKAHTLFLQLQARSILSKIRCRT